MITPTLNPFNITKAVHFSDQEINDYWVDISEEGGFEKLIKPTSKMPMFILGGKGSGKTHLMRYFSYSLQKIRYGGNIVAGVESDGYLGVYLRSSGLNSPRFKGKGLEDETWEDVFVYYMELWLAQLVLENVSNSFYKSEELKSNEREICNKITGLFDLVENASLSSISELIKYIRGLQKELDFAINNCAIRRKINIKISVTRGKLIFGIPEIFVHSLPSLKNCLFLYLIDEFENLSKSQQKYINTILREKEGPCSFKIGSRLYGIKTYDTYSGGEQNKIGSEFEVLHLDDILRKSTEYKDYAKRLIASRFDEYRRSNESEELQKNFRTNLSARFEEFPKTRFASEETKFIFDAYEGKERPYFKALRAKLHKGFNRKLTVGIESEEDVENVINKLRYPETPLMEKVNILLFYKRWNLFKEDLNEVANEISSDCKKYVEDNDTSTMHDSEISHFKSDLLAQLLRECGRDQKYWGLDTFIEMSWGLPRNLFVLLKNIFAWAIFYGEKPFSDKKISIKAQNVGVIDASNWFYNNAMIAGKKGIHARDCIDKLGNFFREIRFSDKPSECSCVTFSADISKATERTREMIELAKNCSLLIEVGTQSDRNTGRIDSKLQLNRMLTPRWDLSMYRRGALVLNTLELNAIFDPDCDGKALTDRIAGMMAPQFRKALKEETGQKRNKDEKQRLLPGL